MSYVYIRSEPGLWTVGFYDPDGKWQPESDHSSEEGAAQRVHFLHGGNHTEFVAELSALVLRCDGEEGVREDGSNIDTSAAHALLDRVGWPS